MQKKEFGKTESQEAQNIVRDYKELEQIEVNELFENMETQRK